MIFNSDKVIPPLYIGIDISKEIFDICQMQEDGKVLKTLQITSDLTGFKKLTGSIPDNMKPHFIMESTGPFSGNINKYLTKKGFNCIICNAFEISRLREAFSYKIKNDKIDAWVLAQAARMNIIKHSSIESKYTYLRDILERQYDLTDRKTSLMNQLHANLVETFPEIDKIFTKLDSYASLGILTKYQSAGQFLSADNKEIKKIINQNKGRMPLSKIDKLRDLCRNSVAWKTGKIYQQIIRSLVKELQIIMKELIFIFKLRDEYIEEIFPQEIKLLKSVPGYGDKTASYMLAVMGNPERFDPGNDGKGSKRISSFVGFSVIEYSSGPRKNKFGLNKRGNSKLRGLLYMAALSAIRADPDIKAKFEKKKKRSDGRKALVSIGHLLLRRGYGVLKTGKMYNAAIPAAA